MSAYELSNALIPELKSKSADFICLNFANGDMDWTYWSNESGYKSP